MDTLIRSYAAQDKTGLNNRLFFDNQLATLLEDQEKVGRTVVMMIRLPDFAAARQLGTGRRKNKFYADQPALDLYYALSRRAAGALSPQRFCRAVAAPHAERGGKHRRAAAEGGGCAAASKMLDRDDMMHIGICAWRSGQSTEQVMEHAEAATRNAVLQGE
jgi:RNase E specificity factor CsrD